MNSTRLNRHIVFLLMICLVSPSCKRSAAHVSYDPSKIDATPAPGDIFIEPSIGDASVFNPLLSTDSASNDINNLVYNGLLKYDKDIQLIGDLAESWKVENGGRLITFNLRKNVLWHDGVPFTAEDVLFTYQKLIDPNTRTPFSSDYKIVKSARVISPYVFQVTYAEPFAPALESWGIGIIPKHIYEKGDINDHPANRSPVGTGPYKFKLWKADQKVELVANDKYFEGRPYFDRYVYRIIPDLSVQFLELRQGSWSIMSPSPDQYNGYDEFFTYYNKFKYPAFRYDYIALNQHNPLFMDIRVRRALAHAINKKEIIDGVYQGLAVASTGPFPPSSWAWNPDVKDVSFDLEKAKALLAEAGWKDTDGDGFLDKDGKPFKFTLITNQGNKVRETIAQIVQNSFKKIGIDMEIRILEWSVFIQKFITPREFEATLLAWNLSRDPDAFSIWHSSQIGPNEYNMIYYKNEEVDRLLVQGRTTYDPEKRKPIYHKIHQLIADDVPYLFLVTPMSLPVVHKKIMGVEMAPAGLGWNFQHWYTPRAWQTKNELSS